MSFAPVYDDRSRALILGTWPSPRSRELTRLFHSTCEAHGIWHDNSKIFHYMAQFEEKSQQMRLF